MTKPYFDKLSTNGKNPTNARPDPFALSLSKGERRTTRLLSSGLQTRSKENTPHTARMAHDQALAKAMQLLLKDDTQVYKQFVENESFRREVTDIVYALTSQ